MKLLLCVAAFLSVAVGFRYADAAEKAPKPVVCVNYRVIDPGMAVCSDAKKPFLMRQFVVAVMPGQDSSAVKVLVGWR